MTDTPTPELIEAAREFADAHEDYPFESPEQILAMFAAQVSARERDAAVTAERTHIAKVLGQFDRYADADDVFVEKVVEWYKDEFAAELKEQI